MTDEAITPGRPLQLSAGAALAKWIVCERTGRWALALRREPAAARWRIWETRTLEECWEMLAASPASFVVAEMTRPGAGAVLHRLAWLERDFPQVRVAVVAERALAPWEELMREAGAVWFCTSPREVYPLAQIARRHFSAAPKRRQTVVEQIWASLPWGIED